MATETDARHGDAQGDEREALPQLRTTVTASSGGSRAQRAYDEASPRSPSEQRPSKLSPTKDQPKRICRKCGEPLTGQFVRALGGTFHLDCFKCRDCQVVVAQKFFPVDDPNEGTYPLCETDYFRRLELLCHACGNALRGSYITALERKYHIEHFTCCVCPTVFGPQDSYYEHDGQVYCHFHYSTRFAARCQGCQTAILKQFVEILRNGIQQHWHPECYMIHKFWSVKLAPGEPAERPYLDPSEARRPDNPLPETRNQVRISEEQMEKKVYRIWSVLSTFEESSAANISDMLLHVSNGAYFDGVLVAEKFIWHVEILFSSTDNLDAESYRCNGEALSYSREAKLLCKKIVAFFTLLSKTQETGVRKLGVTQELLSLVTGLAHYLKLLIRISLQGALRLERDNNRPQALDNFLGELSELEAAKQSRESFDLHAASARLADLNSDLCVRCQNTIEDECIMFEDRRWHIACFTCDNCSRDLRQNIYDARWSNTAQRILCSGCVNQRIDATPGFQHVTKLKQYVYLLRVALARLLNMLREGGALPHTSDDPNLTGYDSSGNLGEPALLRSESRSKSYGGEQADSLSNTINDVRRLRSQRLNAGLASTGRKARQSRIIDGPQADMVRTGSPGPDDHFERGQQRGFRIVEDRDQNGDAVNELTFGDEKTLTLDDIPRIAATEQARELRPNAFKHRTSGFGIPSGVLPTKLMNGHQRDMSGDAARSPVAQTQLKRYFSELSAIDYFIVRHVACIMMLPLVEEHFNMEELLSLIERSGKPTFWDKFGKAFNKDGKKQKQKKTGVFGVPLEVLVEKDGAESSLGIGPGTLRIPAIIDDTITAMKQMDMSVEGVFRKNGNIRRLKEMAAAIDTGSETLDLPAEGPVQVAALLKRFLRDLPDPLLTYKLHRLFITSQKLTDDDKKRRVLHLTCCLLPKAHRDSVEVLFSFLNWVASFSHIDEDSGSKMDTHNLATVITPNILFSKSTNPGMDDSFLAIEAIHNLILYNDQMSEVPEDLWSIVHDKNIFAASAELTTKDILKRYQEFNKGGPPPPGQPPGSVPSVSPRPPGGKGGEGRAPAAVYYKVPQGDEPQTGGGNQAWSNEVSIKQVNTPPAPQPQSLQGPNYHNGNVPDIPGRADNHGLGINTSPRMMDQTDPAYGSQQYNQPNWGDQGASHQPRPSMGVTGAG